MLSISCNTFHNIYRIQNCDCISNIQICQIKFCILSEIMFVVVLNILAILSVAIRTNIPIYIFPSHYWNYTRNLIINWNVVFVAQLLDQTEAMANKDLSLKLILQKHIVLSFTSIDATLHCIIMDHGVKDMIHLSG